MHREMPIDGVNVGDRSLKISLFRITVHCDPVADRGYIAMAIDDGRVVEVTVGVGDGGGSVLWMVAGFEVVG